MNAANLRSVLAACLLTFVAAAAHAAGPLFTTAGPDPVPLRWDTSSPVPVYTDGGGAFAYDFDGVTPFITIERANEITEFAFDQWNAVATSTFEATVAGTIDSQIGIEDVTDANAAQLYTQQNGYGFWVLYDSDGSILENFFGVPRSAVLGIAFPEWADSNGTIVEATALINGWNVDASDSDGTNVAGVFTHEFGHAINLSHSQVNGQMAYFSRSFSPLYPGVPGCGVDPVLRWDSPVDAMDTDAIETMYPLIDHTRAPGQAMSTVDVRDDIVAISNLYPTAGYAATFGSISGVLTLKDGTTDYSGVNIVARNLADPFADAVSAMSGDQTQGKIGPDGRFTINGLTPGGEYTVYVEPIFTGGFPTQPMPLASEAEYWNAAESSDPAVDDACDATPIVAAAGMTQTTDLIFNGYAKGVDFLPIPVADFTDVAKNGRHAAGSVSGLTVFRWDETKGLSVVPGATGSAYINRNGTRLAARVADEAGVRHAALWTTSGVIRAEPVEGAGSCVGSSNDGPSKSTVWGMDDAGHNVVGFVYVDRDGDGVCPQRRGEILPYVWNPKDGMKLLDTSAIPTTASFIRAQGISGNGEVILGSIGGSSGLAWVGDQMFDLKAMANVREAYTINHDGTKAVLGVQSGPALIWDYRLGADGFTDIGTVRWCDDVPFIHFFFGNLCDQGFTHEDIVAFFGPPPMFPLGVSDDGGVITGRTGSFFTGISATLWTEATGWMTLPDFMEKQGVVEVRSWDLFNPINVSASGREIFGTAANGSGYRINLDQVYVCVDGVSVLTGWPGGMANALAAGAELGRCEFLD